TTQNTQCYQCLTPYYSSLIILCRGGQFLPDEEVNVSPIIPMANEFIATLLASAITIGMESITHCWSDG
ncbi:MAG: hypothetical protein WCH09_06265, partial [Bacteroidota bacterium]